MVPWHPMQTGTGIKRNLTSTCCLQDLQCFCPLKNSSPNLLSLQLEPKTKKKKETFTVLPVKFHLTGRNDPREQSKMMEIEFKPLVCSCGSSGCRSLCAGTHRIWEVLTSLQSQAGPSVVCDSGGSRRGWGSSCSYLYCTEQLISTRKEKNNHHF